MKSHALISPQYSGRQTSLDRAFKEISDLRKENLESVNKAQSEALELEVLFSNPQHAMSSTPILTYYFGQKIKKNEELHHTIETLKRGAEEREAALRREVNQTKKQKQKQNKNKTKTKTQKTSHLSQLIELRASVQRVEDQAGWREDNLRREIAVCLSFFHHRSRSKKR